MGRFRFLQGLKIDGNIELKGYNRIQILL